MNNWRGDEAAAVIVWKPLTEVGGLDRVEGPGGGKGGAVGRNARERRLIQSCGEDSREVCTARAAGGRERETVEVELVGRGGVCGGPVGVLEAEPRRQR